MTCDFIENMLFINLSTIPPFFTYVMEAVMQTHKFHWISYLKYLFCLCTLMGIACSNPPPIKTPPPPPKVSNPLPALPNIQNVNQIDPNIDPSQTPKIEP
jgi:hypothetical protein